MTTDQNLYSKSMSQARAKLRLEDLDIKPYMITKLKMAGIQSVFDLAISIPHQLTDISGVMLKGTDEHVALELVTKAKKVLVDSGLLYKDFSTAQDILDRRKNLLRCTTGSAKPDHQINYCHSRDVYQVHDPGFQILPPFWLYEQVAYSSALLFLFYLPYCRRLGLILMPRMIFI